MHYAKLSIMDLTRILITSVLARVQPVPLRYGVIANATRNLQPVALCNAQRKGILAKENLQREIKHLPLSSI